MKVFVFLATLAVIMFAMANGERHSEGDVRMRDAKRARFWIGDVLRIYGELKNGKVPKDHDSWAKGDCFEKLTGCWRKETKDFSFPIGEPGSTQAEPIKIGLKRCCVWESHCEEEFLCIGLDH